MLTEEDDLDLQRAVRSLESPGLAIRVANFVGRPIEEGVKSLPDNWQGKIDGVAKAALEKALDGALLTIRDHERQKSSDWYHLGATMGAGAVGGAFGLAALSIELPVTTVIMMRSILDIARAEGEDIRTPEAALASIEVFALGSEKTSDDDAAETAYYAQRIALAQIVSQASSYMAKVGGGKVSAESAPILVRLITAVAARFGIQVQNKVLAQAIPVVGAVGGAGVNAMFMDHYQSMARGHFIVRRLERTYGADVVKARYEHHASGGRIESAASDGEQSAILPAPEPESP